MDFKKKSIFRLFSKFLSIKNNDTWRNIDPVDFLLICGDSDKGSEKNGLPFSKLMDSMHQILNFYGFTCDHLSPEFSFFVNNKSWSKSKSFNRQALFISSFTLFSKCLPEKFKNLISRFCLFNSFPITIEDFYENLLIKSKIKFIICIDGKKSLFKVGKKLKIPVIELIHGIGYSTFDGLNIIELKTEDELPFQIWTLDPITSRNLNFLFEKSPIQILEIPHPWYTRLKENKWSKNLPIDWLTAINYIPNQNQKIILLTLQWGYDADHGSVSELKGILPNGLIPDPLLDLISDSKNDFFWCIRRHPVQMTNKNYKHQIKFLDEICKKNKNVEWVESSKSDFHVLLNKVDCHITMQSMSCYEAALYGVKTLALCPLIQSSGIFNDMFNDLENEGYLIKALPNQTIILDFIKNSKKLPLRKISNADIYDFETILKNLCIMN